MKLIRSRFAILVIVLFTAACGDPGPPRLGSDDAGVDEIDDASSGDWRDADGDSDSNGDSDPDTGTDPDAGSDPNADTDANPDVGSEPDADADPDSGTVPDSGSDPDADPDPDPDPDPFEPDESPLTAMELELYEAINEYRVEEGLPEVPLSYSLTVVARTHVQDLIDHGSTVLAGACNLHSWSDQGPWTPCCYDSHAKASCMHNKPNELTNYTSAGFEISVSGASSATTALNAWKGSSGHRNVILNEGTWASYPWQAMGVGIEGGYSHVWFGTATDPDDFPE